MGEQGSGEIWIGGLNLELKQRICDQLSLSGFVVNGDSPRYRGVHPANIVNLASERGVQIELSGNVIAAMFAMEGPPFGRRVTQLPTTERFDAFVGAVRSAIGLEAAA
jgi:phage replication-related protein YjqB (UPF0714/DUF867 family)